MYKEYSYISYDYLKKTTLNTIIAAISSETNIDKKVDLKATEETNSEKE